MVLSKISNLLRPPIKINEWKWTMRNVWSKLEGLHVRDGSLRLKLPEYLNIPLSLHQGLISIIFYFYIRALLLFLLSLWPFSSLSVLGAQGLHLPRNLCQKKVSNLAICLCFYLWGGAGHTQSAQSLLKTLPRYQYSPNPSYLEMERNKCGKMLRLFYLII